MLSRFLRSSVAGRSKLSTRYARGALRAMIPGGSRSYATESKDGLEIEERGELQTEKPLEEHLENVDLSSVTLSPEVEAKLNTEFSKFVKEFALDYDFFEEKAGLLQDSPFRESDFKKVLDQASGVASQKAKSHGNLRGQNDHMHVVSSPANEPYTAQELFLRRLFHARNLADKGSTLEDIYEPHKDLHSPPNIKQTTIATLLAAGAHLGHSTSLFRENNQPFVYGIRDGIHIIDLNHTLSYLIKACKVIEGISARGGVVLYVGTLPGQERTVQIAADRSSGYYVHTRWIPGTFTNATQISGTWERVEVDQADVPSGRQLTPELKKAIVKPDVVVILNPVENRNLINECRLSRIPTIGIVDTNCEPSLVSYPIPANDDSLRATDLIAGTLSRSAQYGRESRINAARKREKGVKNVKEGNAVETSDGADHVSVTETESLFESVLESVPEAETESKETSTQPNPQA